MDKIAVTCVSIIGYANQPSLACLGTFLQNDRKISTNIIAGHITDRNMTSPTLEHSPSILTNIIHGTIYANDVSMISITVMLLVLFR